VEHEDLAEALARGGIDVGVVPVGEDAGVRRIVGRQVVRQDVERVGGEYGQATLRWLLTPEVVPGSD